jgi:hypothetical protein
MRPKSYNHRLTDYPTYGLTDLVTSGLTNHLTY